MKKIIIATSLIAAVAFVALAGDLFTNITSHYPPDMARQANAALDALEDAIDGSAPVAPSTISVTNGAVLNLTMPVNNVTATEAATNTVANPGAAGRIVVIVNAGTNNITIAKGANIALSAASHAITPNGTLTLVSQSATAWKEVANAKGNTVE